MNLDRDCRALARVILASYCLDPEERAQELDALATVLTTAAEAQLESIEHRKIPAPVAPPAEPRPHVHRWNSIDRCCDPACGAVRCAHLARLDAAPGIRASWNRCSRAAADGAKYCAERHGHLNAESQSA